MGRDRNDGRGAMNGRAGLTLLLAFMTAGLLTACLRENEVQQQQTKALLYSGVATGMRHNTLMDAAFGSENEWVGADAFAAASLARAGSSIGRHACRTHRKPSDGRAPA